MNLLHQNENGVWGKFIVDPPNSTRCRWREATESELAFLKRKRRGKANEELNKRFAEITEEVKKELGDLYG
tara:strand:- start:5333 stop:5545 length:213 start_codon:yes stop_codon:yes gene_type:complete